MAHIQIFFACRIFIHDNVGRESENDDETLGECLSSTSSSWASLLFSTAGIRLHHLLQASFRSGQNEQLAALLTLWLVNPCWSLVPSPPCVSLNFLSQSAKAFLDSLAAPVLHVSANGLGIMCTCVHYLMRSKLCQSQFILTLPVRDRTQVARVGLAPLHLSGRTMVSEGHFEFILFIYYYFFTDGGASSF